jgi:Tfp pilus assembly protein PilN
MTQVNLLPTEARQVQRTRRATMLAAMAVVAAVALLVGVFFLENTRLSSAQSDLATQQSKNAALQQQIAGLQRYADLAAQKAQKQLIVDDVTKAVVPWSGVLRDLSSVIPSDVFLRSFSVTVQLSPGGVTLQQTDTGLIGTIQVQGTAISHNAVALWLNRLAEVHGWVNGWVTTSQLQSDGTTQFTGSIDLTQRVTTKGGKQ